MSHIQRMNVSQARCQALQNIEFIYVRLSDDQQEFDHCQKSIKYHTTQNKKYEIAKDFLLRQFRIV